MNEKEFVVALVVNPVAGMGGSVGLKGTDGAMILEKAISLGAKPHAMARGVAFLEALKPIQHRIKLLLPPGPMGEDCFKHSERIAGYTYQVVPVGESVKFLETRDRDTIEFVNKVKKIAQLIVFVGGDGTARNVLEGIELESKVDTPVIGVPAGVKIHSSVFGINPKNTAMLVLKYFAGEIGITEGEVMDIDEDAFRKDRLLAKLYGYLSIPYAPAFLQGSKQGSPVAASDQENKVRIAEFIVNGMEKNFCYIVGPGSTTKPIFELLELEKTILGVDAVLNGKLFGSDLNEDDLLSLIKKMRAKSFSVKLILTVIGAQGFLFGRGNLQFSPEFIRLLGIPNINIIMTRHKFSTLPDGKMRNDTRDPSLDEEMKGYYRVLVDEGEYKIIYLE